MQNTKMSICDAIIHPGETAHLALPLPEQFSCLPLYMPIKVAHGAKKGPCFLVFSVLAGNELNGLEIVNRFFNQLDPKKMSGTVIAIPVVNVYGLTHYPKMLPSGKHLADCFPGKESGTFGERFAHIFTREILQKADFCVECNTGGTNHNILPQIYCDFKDPKSKQLAKVFQTPIVTHVDLSRNNLRKTAEELQVTFMVYQGGEAMRFDESVIDLGVNGLCNMLRESNILEQTPKQEFKPIFSKDEDWIVAHKGGVLHTQVSLGQTIQKGELIGKITDPFVADAIDHVYSEYEGIVVGINTTPLVYEGLAIFKIAAFLDTQKAESVIEEWDKKNNSLGE